MLSFSSPANNAVLNSSTVTVAFSSSGDLSQAHHAHIMLDGVEVAMTTGLSGTTQLTGVTAGAHTLDGYLARADHSGITGSDATSGALHGEHRESERSVDRRPVEPDHRAAADGGGEPESACTRDRRSSGRAISPRRPTTANSGIRPTNAITDVPNPFSNIFCSAAVHLADGRLLVAGGHDKANGVMGIADSNTFDPVTQTWQRLPDMAFRRWYPTLTMLGDGKAIILAGSANSETVNVEIPEIFDPVARTWTQTQRRARCPFRSIRWSICSADGRLVQSGTTEHPTATRTLDIATQTWTTIDSRVLDGGSGVMYAPGRIMKSGSSSNDGETPTADSTRDDLRAEHERRQPCLAADGVDGVSAHVPQSHQPRGWLGARDFRHRARKARPISPRGVLQAELWSPDTETWTTMAPTQMPRIYHSTAILLPDARVAVSGSGNIAGGTDQTNLEIYSPPYLFKGARPTITSAPSLVKYGSSFFVQTPDGAGIRAVNLIRPGAATHNFDQDQRFVPVTFSVVSGGIQVNAPSNSNLLPPGYYMLFLVSNAGVPSVAKFVRFPAPYEDSEPPTAPGNLQGTGTIGSAR